MDCFFYRNKIYKKTLWFAGCKPSTVIPLVCICTTSTSWPNGTQGKNNIGKLFFVGIEMKRLANKYRKDTNFVRLSYKFCFHGLLQSVLRIHDILGWIRIRGSKPLTNGSWSGFGSGSCYFRHWPSRCEQKNNFFTQFFLLYTFWRNIYIIFQR